MPDEVTNGEIVRRLDDLRRDFRDMQSGMQNGYVTKDKFEDWKKDVYGPRVRGVEDDLKEVRLSFEAKKLEDDRRFRTTVNLFIAGGISLFGGTVLLLVNLVAK